MASKKKGHKYIPILILLGGSRVHESFERFDSSLESDVILSLPMAAPWRYCHSRNFNILCPQTQKPDV